MGVQKPKEPSRMVRTLPRAFYDRSTALVARELLGTYLIRRSGSERRIGRIVEVEAYLGPHDLASHSSKGPTARNRVMFGPPGHAYVYLIYGMHHCLNVVTEGEGQGAAVLLRALEPMQGIGLRTSGPGLLCRALEIDRRLNGHDLLAGELTLAADPEEPAPAVVRRPRIGVDYAGAWARRHLRFYIRGNAFVSKK
jgi:DNA-3-methyladenine glycosylase